MVIFGILKVAVFRFRSKIAFVTAKDASLTDDLRRLATTAHTEDSLVYGEVDMGGFVDLLLNDVPRKVTRDDVFYDLGSGSGRAVLAARYAGDFGGCVGVELLENLHDIAESVRLLYKFRYQSKLVHRNVRFVRSDLLECDWAKDGTVVYVPNLLFDDELKGRIAEMAVGMRPDSCLMCLKKFGGDAFDSAFELVKERMVPMSWGESNVYIYRRR